MTSDDHDPELAALRAELGAGRWYLFRGENGGDGILHAWREPRDRISPPVVLYDGTADGLRARCAEFEREYAETGSLQRARAAAERLQT